MALKIGIVGLPNVGKSTLFNAITNSEVEAANYPFATIEPNIGVVEVKDERVEFLQKAFNSKKKIYNQIIFTDIAGLVKGASKGEGLGNKFLSNIRECDAIIHVVRLFENNDIVHVENTVDPIRDIEIINLELIISDMEQLSKWLVKMEKKMEMTGTETEKFQLKTIKKANSLLESNLKIEDGEWIKEELDVLKPFNLLTGKPTIYLANVSEEEIKNLKLNKHFEKFEQFIKTKNKTYVPISTQIEYEISKLDDESQKVFLEDLGLTESGLNKVAKECFKILNLQTYFTCGPEEIHAWAFEKGILAPQAAGIIHTDFQKGFIKAEIYRYADLVEYKTEVALKEKGLIRLEGKEYVMQDGDICHFRFNL